MQQRDVPRQQLQRDRRRRRAVLLRLLGGQEAAVVRRVYAPELVTPRDEVDRARLLGGRVERRVDRELRVAVQMRPPATAEPSAERQAAF